MSNEYDNQQPDDQRTEMVNPAPQGNTDPYQQQNYQQQNYQQYNYQQNGQYDYSNTAYQPDYGQGGTGDNNGMDTRPLTMGEWVLTLLAMCIPCCIGIILYIIWAFSKKGNINRRNYCRAALIVMLVIGVVYMLVMSVAGGAIYSLLMNSGYQNLY